MIQKHSTILLKASKSTDLKNFLKLQNEMFKTGIFETIYLCELEFENIMLIKQNRSNLVARPEVFIILTDILNA